MRPPEPCPRDHGASAPDPDPLAGRRPDIISPVTPSPHTLDGEPDGAWLRTYDVPSLILSESQSMKGQWWVFISTIGDVLPNVQRVIHIDPPRRTLRFVFHRWTAALHSGAFELGQPGRIWLTLPDQATRRAVRVGTVQRIARVDQLAGPIELLKPIAEQSGMSLDDVVAWLLAPSRSFGGQLPANQVESAIELAASRVWGAEWW